MTETGIWILGDEDRADYEKGALTSLKAFTEDENTGDVLCDMHVKISPDDKGLPLAIVKVNVKSGNAVNQTFAYKEVSKEDFGAELKKDNFKDFYVNSSSKYQDLIDRACEDLFEQDCEDFLNL